MLWNRSLDAHAEKIDHGLIKMFMRFRIKVHRKLPDSARDFDRAALKSDENRELLNQAYETARDEYDRQFPPMTQSNAPRETTSVIYRQKMSENQSSNFCPATERHTSSTPERHPNRLFSNLKAQKSPELGPNLAQNEPTAYFLGRKYGKIKVPNFALRPSGIHQTPRNGTRTALKPLPQTAFTPEIDPTRCSRAPVQSVTLRLLTLWSAGSTPRLIVALHFARSNRFQPQNQLFYAQRVKSSYRKKTVPAPTLPPRAPPTGTRTHCMHPQKSISHPKIATGPRNFLQLSKQLRRQHRRK